MSENYLENNHKTKETGINSEFIIQKGASPAILILVSKSKVNTLTGEELTTKEDRLKFMRELLVLKEVKVGENNYSNVGYADFQLKLLGFDSDIYAQFLLESLKINKRTLELLSNEFLGTKNTYDLWTVESVFKNPQIADKIKFYNNPVLRITETKAKNITYQIGRKVQIPGCKEELLIEEIKDSDIVLQGLACRYVLPKSYVERYNPPNNLEKLMTFKDKSSKVIEKTIFAMESFAVMAKQFGKLDMIYQDGVPKYIIKPHANIIIDPRENGSENYHGADNKYYPAFSRIKELGYKIIDLDNPDQKEIIANIMEIPEEYLQTPNLRLDLFGSGGGLQYLEHHRIMAAMAVGLPIVVDLKKYNTYN